MGHVAEKMQRCGYVADDEFHNWLILNKCCGVADIMGFYRKRTLFRAELVFRYTAVRKGNTMATKRVAERLRVTENAPSRILTAPS
jgi:hypothetical protein